MLTRILATTAVALALSAPALAQQQDEQRPDQLEGRTAPDTTTRFPDQRPPEQQAQEQQAQSADELPTDQLALAQSDSIKGSAVSNPQGEQVGDIQDVVVDVRKGDVAFAVVGVGGFLGVGEKNVAVPWDRLQPGPQPQSFVLDADRQTLERAPSLDLENVARMQEPQIREEVTAFWREIPERSGTGQPR